MYKRKKSTDIIDISDLRVMAVTCHLLVVWALVLILHWSTSTVVWTHNTQQHPLVLPYEHTCKYRLPNRIPYIPHVIPIIFNVCVQDSVKICCKDMLKYDVDQIVTHEYYIQNMRTGVKVLKYRILNWITY